MLAEVNGVRLAFSDSGVGSPVVLLVHGFPLNRAMWEPQLEPLRSAGCRVVAPDLRGFGASEMGPAGPLAMDRHADDLAGLLDHLRIAERVVYVGLSMGGYVGFAFWRRHGARVRAMLLADTRAGPDSPEARQGRLDMADQVERARSSEIAARAMLPRMFAPSVQADEVLWTQVRTMMLQTSPEGVAGAQRGIAARPDSTDTLATIDVPTLVVVGEHDQLTPPAEARAMVERLPRGVLEVVPRAGHLSNLENPPAFNAALLRFVGLLGNRDT